MLQCHDVAVKSFGESPQKMILPYMILPTLSPALIETPLQDPRGSDKGNLGRGRSPFVKICVFRGKHRFYCA
jgi:hypothetical protein